MYQFLATLDLRTSEVCRALDGKTFPVSERKVGVNCNPMHPWCRSTTVAVIDGISLENMTRSATDSVTGEAIKVPQSMTYKQWYDKFVKDKKSIVKDGDSGIIKSGAISGARNPYGAAAEEHAKRYYGLVRSMKTDVAKIAKTTGYAETEIQEIKNYIFIDEHDLGERGLCRFDPDYMMGESWRRLMEGNPETHDLTLIHHEIMEKDLIRKGISQEEAHIITSKKYNYDKEANEYYGQIKKYKKE